MYQLYVSVYVFIFTYKWVLRHLSWIDWWLSGYIVTLLHAQYMAHVPLTGPFTLTPEYYIVWNQKSQFQITKIPGIELNPWADPKMMIPRSSFEETIINIDMIYCLYLFVMKNLPNFLGQNENPPRTHHPGSLHLELNFQCELTSDPSGMQISSTVVQPEMSRIRCLGWSSRVSFHSRNFRYISKFKEGPPGRTGKIGLFSPDINIPHLSKPNISTTTRQEAPWFQRPHQHWAQNTPRSTHLEPCQRVELGWMFNESSMPR